MGPALVALGSNLGDRLGFLSRAVRSIAEDPGFRIVSISSVYETEPVGKKDQPLFLNAALALTTSLSPDSVLVHLKGIERRVGRTPSERWGPREIDLDLIYLGGLVMNSPGLTIPHPEAAGRRFVLTPLAEIAPDFIDPVCRCTLSELLQRCPDLGSVTRLSSTIQSSSAEN